jgi:hypothetical protein
MFRSNGHAAAVEAALIIDLSPNPQERERAIKTLNNASRADLDAAHDELPETDGRQVVRANSNTRLYQEDASRIPSWQRRRN